MELVKVFYGHNMVLCKELCKNKSYLMYNLPQKEYKLVFYCNLCSFKLETAVNCVYRNYCRNSSETLVSDQIGPSV